MITEGAVRGAGRGQTLRPVRAAARRLVGGMNRYFASCLVLADVAALSGLYILLVWIRFPADFTDRVYPEALLTLVGVSCFFLSIVGGYARGTDFVSLRYAAEHVIAFLFIALIAPLAIYSLSAYTQTIKPGRLTVAVSILGFLAFSYLFRRFMGVFRWRYARQQFVHVLGDGPMARNFYLRLKRLRWPYQLRFHAIDSDRVGRNLIPEDPESPVLQGGFPDALPRGDRLEAVVLAEELERLDKRLVDELLRLHLHRIQVQSLNAFYATSLRLVPLSEVSPAWVFEADLRLREQAISCRAKRVLDVLCASVGLVLAGPMIPLIAAAVRLDSKGPVLFRQPRAGRFGQPFMVLKFRTMRTDMSEGSRYTLEDDPRITRVGRFLRRHRLDEIPQMINVLRGEMSLIGPRAEWTVLAADYERAIPYYGIRHAVRPGVTGWAQVNYPYGASIADTREKLRYDLYYVRYYSLFLDLSIILKTIFTVLHPSVSRTAAQSASSPEFPDRAERRESAYAEMQSGAESVPMSHR